MPNDLQSHLPTRDPMCSTDRCLYLSEGLSIKGGTAGANIENLDYRLQATFPDVIDVWKRYGYDNPFITSGNDGKHTSSRSLHYEDLAIDIRGRDIPDANLRKMAVELQKRLGKDYFVGAEFFSEPSWDHIHIQWRK